MSNPDFYYVPTDEQLRAYAELSPLERLKRLADLRRFLIVLRDAPTVTRRAAEPDPPPSE
jgi:hypothetical protein